MIFLILGGILLAAVIAGVLYQRRGTRADALRYPPPGRLVEVQGRRYHVQEIGSGEPLVVLESGIASSSISWHFVREGVSAFSKVLSYDRAGYGWSDARLEPRTAEQLTAELMDLLNAAGHSGPCVLVGHSFGGILVRLFAQRYPHLVAGLVLVDPLDPEEFLTMDARKRRMLAGGVALSRWGALLARLGVVRFALARMMAGSRWLPRSIGLAASGGPGMSVIERILGQLQKLPEATWTPIRAHWCQPKSFVTMAGHLRQLPESVRAIDDGAPVAAPLITLSAGDASPHRLARQDALAAQSPAGTHRLAKRSTHWIQLDEPELIVEAVREVIAIHRRRPSAGGGTV